VAYPPEQARVLALGRSVKLHEPEIQLDVGDPLQHRFDLVAPVVPDPEEFVVQLDRAEHPLVLREALGKAACKRCMVVVARPRLGRSHRVLEGIVDERDEAEIGAQLRVIADSAENGGHMKSHGRLGMTEARAASRKAYE
jgi:hypothetical protein